MRRYKQNPYRRIPKLYDTTNIFDYLRASISPWIAMTRETYKNKCVLTGVTYNIEVHHHIKTYRDIVNQAFEELKIPFTSRTKNLTYEQLKQLSDKVLEIHMELGPGVCLTHKVHKQLHAKTGGGFGIRYKEFAEQYKKHMIKCSQRF